MRALPSLPRFGETPRLLLLTEGGDGGFPDTAISPALPRPGAHPWPMDTIPDPEVPERPTRRRFSAARAGRTGRWELPRPAYEAIRRTLGDCGKELATIAPDESLWQAGAGSRGIASSTFYARFRRYLQAAGLAPSGVHITRHTAAKLRRDADESIEAVSAFLDHSSLAVTTIYLRRLEGETDRAWADVAAAIGV